MVTELMRWFERIKENTLVNGEDVTHRREKNAYFGYYIVLDWEDAETKEPHYFTAVDHDGLPIMFPDSDSSISGETEEDVRNRMDESYPNSVKLEKGNTSV